jgi:lysophospholipase L1-like esterase
MRIKAIAVLAAAVSFALPTCLRAQAALSVYVSLGDSLAAGFSNGALVESHQRVSVPALIARQARLEGFEQPLVGEPGIPAELALASLVPVPTIAPKSADQGAPLNPSLGRPYNNLAVPGATVQDALVTQSGGYHDLVLRRQGSQVAQAAALAPTFVTLWIGNNDVLGAVVRGTAVDGVTLTPVAAFKSAYEQLAASLKATGAFVIAANLPDVTAIPFATTLRAVVVDPLTGQPVLADGQPVPLLGSKGPLPTGSLVTLAASPYLTEGIGIPSAQGGTGLPLPDEVVLDPAETAAIRDRVKALNQVIRDVCQASGFSLLDVHALMDEVSTRGREVGGVTLTSDFLTGGVFSYDGVHLTDLGYAVVANEWIALINAGGGHVPLVDLGPFLGFAPGGGAGPAGTASFRRDPAAAGAHARARLDPRAWAALLKVFPKLGDR